MKRLTNGQQASLQELLGHLAEAKAEFEREWTELGDQIAQVNSALESYNGVLAEIETQRDEIASDMESYFDERSDKWQESDAGSAFADWKSEWENASVHAVDLVEMPDEPELDHADEIEALPQECPS